MTLSHYQHRHKILSSIPEGSQQHGHQFWMFLRTCLDYVHTEAQTGLTQAGPKSQKLERTDNRVI